MIRPSLLIVLACVGCAETTTPPAAPVSVPRHAGAWHQFCEQAWNVQQASQLAAARGADGWELVAMYNGVLCFKRPAHEAREHRPQVVPSAPASASPGVPYVPLVRDPGF